MTQEEQGKRLVESLEQLSQAWRSMGQIADTLCESLEKLLKRKEALTWKWIGACEEINAQIETLRATPTEGDEHNESCTED